MESINISSRDFDAFLALADTLHFTRASERCHLSQSAFSQKIARIEEMAGVALFERSTRHVTLTPEGEGFAEEVRRIQHDLQMAVLRLKELATKQKGKVAIAALPSVAATWMPQIIGRYRNLYPGIQVELFDTLADSALSMLREGRVDMAITSGGDLREFEVTELRSEEFFLVCSQNHQLAKQTSITLKQLKDENWIHLARTSSVRQHLEVAGITPRPGAIEVEHLATVAALVKENLGISAIPELALFHFTNPDLATVPIANMKLKRPIFLVKRKGGALSTAALAMLEGIISRASNR